MEAKVIDLDRTLYDLTAEHPELINLLFELGFMGARNPVMRETHGKQMSVRDGCAHLGINIEKVEAALKSRGFEVK
ncbi:MAG: DUF1858 domain-containing protein [Elusimicrobiales bacterium]|nr:DUF1858 domain-containing protein [Elusimicrobiales bacterium]